MRKERFVCLALAALMSLGMTASVFAADTKIDNVKVTFSYDGEEPKSGDSIGSISATAGSGNYTINNVEFVSDNEVWSVGDRPVVRVDLTAEDGYRFSYTSKSHFSLSGCSATYKKAKIYDDGTSMELEVYLKRIGGKLSSVEGLAWSGTTAVWDSLEGSKGYEVRLYRDEKLEKTVESAGTSCNFYADMARAGSYSFRVRAISDYNNRAGEWSDYSEDYYLDEDVAQVNSGAGRWVQDQRGYWYSYSSGGYPVSCWKNINNAWYYFGADGYMLTGWQKISNNWYYLNPSGAMTTGWQNINGTWYYLDGSGVMKTGWQYINNQWYYLDEAGRMYANATTPDGHYVNEAGVRVY